jgi:hypothetical protein
MRKLTMTALLAITLLVTGFLAQGLSNPGAVVGQPSPAFTLTDTNGKTHSLADYRGRYVVLEWLNFDCPFVRKHYRSGNMARLQEQATRDGVIWLSIVSSAEGAQGYFAPAEMNARKAQEGGKQHAILIDEPGTVGRSYGAMVTPHMYVIAPDGRLLYNGAIDDKPTPRMEDVEGARNYVMEALQAARAGREIEVKTSRPYGCAVRYRN